MKKTIRLGTRGSPLALIQAEEVKRRLCQVWPHLALEAEIDIVPIRTTGDWKPEHKDRRFIEIGGNKGLFTKEIEEALLTDYVDMAIHSMKDVSCLLPQGIEIGAIIARNDPRDAFIGRTARALGALPPGAVVGTSSLRRQAQILAQRPDLRVEALRGNVETRLKKMEDGQVDATILATAGLMRLGLDASLFSILPTTTMLPAAAQGALGIEIRSGSDDIRALLVPLDDAPSHVCIGAERAVMRAIDGTCRTPAGAYATFTATGFLSIEALVARADGTNLLRLSASGSPEDAEAIGEKLGEDLRRRSPADLFCS
jgi:hydroxymethylbilane synthase